jgi:hypothetical protein
MIRQLVATTTKTTKEIKNQQRLKLSALRDAPVCSSEVVARYLSSPPLTDLEQQNGVIVKKIAADPLHAIRHPTLHRKVMGTTLAPGFNCRSRMGRDLALNSGNMYSVTTVACETSTANASCTRNSTRCSTFSVKALG